MSHVRRYHQDDWSFLQRYIKMWTISTAPHPHKHMQSEVAVRKMITIPCTMQLLDQWFFQLESQRLCHSPVCSTSTSISIYSFIRWFIKKADTRYFTSPSLRDWKSAVLWLCRNRLRSSPVTKVHKIWTSHIYIIHMNTQISIPWFKDIYFMIRTRTITLPIMEYTNYILTFDYSVLCKSIL